MAIHLLGHFTPIVCVYTRLCDVSSNQYIQPLAYSRAIANMVHTCTNIINVCISTRSMFIFYCYNPNTNKQAISQQDACSPSLAPVLIYLAGGSTKTEKVSDTVYCSLNPAEPLTKSTHTVQHQLSKWWTWWLMWVGWGCKKGKGLLFNKHAFMYLSMYVYMFVYIPLFVFYIKMFRFQIWRSDRILPHCPGPNA